MRDADGNVNGESYDAAGDLIGETHADHGVVSSTFDAFDAFGDKTSSTDALGNVVDDTYDPLGDNLAVIDVDAHVASRVSGQAVNTVENLTSASYTYDAVGRKLTQNLGGVLTTYRYDALGNIAQTADALGDVTTKAYDALNREIAEEDPDGDTATWGYDRYGELVTHTDIGGAQFSYAYDNARQLLTQTGSNGQNQTYTYDAAGQHVLEESQERGRPRLLGLRQADRRADPVRRLRFDEPAAERGHRRFRQGQSQRPGPDAPASQALTVDVRYHHAVSRVISSGTDPHSPLPAGYISTLAGDNIDLSGATNTTSTYDAAGRVLTQHVVNNANGTTQVTDYEVQNAQGQDTGVGNYDAAGNLKGYVSTSSGGGQRHHRHLLSFSARSTVAARSTGAMA